MPLTDRPGTRLVAGDRKSTNRPSALIFGSELELFACEPLSATLTRVV
jgi:hypothetical protein